MRKIAVFAVALFALLSACSSTDRTPPEGTRQYSLSRTDHFVSVRELVQRSSSIADVTATDEQSEETVGPQGAPPEAGLPFTITKMRVNRVLSGSLDQAVVNLRLTGPKDGRSNLPSVRPGRRYIVFLTPFELEAGVPTNQHTIVGTFAGLYEVSGDDVVRLDDESSRLPGREPLQALEKTISDSSR